VAIAEKLSNQFALVRYLCELPPAWNLLGKHPLPEYVELDRHFNYKSPERQFGPERSRKESATALRKLSKKQRVTKVMAKQNQEVDCIDQHIAKFPEDWNLSFDTGFSRFLYYCGRRDLTIKESNLGFLQYYGVFNQHVREFNHPECFQAYKFVRKQSQKLPLVGIEENPGPQRKGKRNVKHAKKGNKKRFDSSTSIVRGPSTMANLMPDTKLMWLEYNLPTTVILTAAASNFAFLNLHPNDLFRPVVGTAVQYTGLTAMDTFYNYYLVKKWQLDMEFINADVVPKEVFVIPTPQDLTGVVSTPAEAQFYVGSRGVPNPKLVSATGGMDRATIRYSMNCPKFYGEPVEYETSYNAVSTGSPANFLNCALVAVTTTANMTFGLMVRLKMRARVKFYQRKVVA